jgi:hypothetical protein
MFNLHFLWLLDFSKLEPSSFSHLDQKFLVREAGMPDGSESKQAHPGTSQSFPEEDCADRKIKIQAPRCC